MERARVRFKSENSDLTLCTCVKDTYNLAIVPKHRGVVVYNLPPPANVSARCDCLEPATTEIFPAGQASKVIYMERAAFFEGRGPRAVVISRAKRGKVGRRTGKNGKEMSLRQPNRISDGCFMRSPAVGAS
jgi:hypothetical protein